jgi:hypothetical protein
VLAIWDFAKLVFDSKSWLNWTSDVLKSAYSTIQKRQVSRAICALHGNLLWRSIENKPASNARLF